jgi:hypothetical protein
MTTITSQSTTAPSPLVVVLDAVATYAAPKSSVAPGETYGDCIRQIQAALDLCGVDGVPHLVFDLAFRLALRDQDQT